MNEAEGSLSPLSGVRRFKSEPRNQLHWEFNSVSQTSYVNSSTVPNIASDHFLNALTDYSLIIKSFHAPQNGVFTGLLDTQ
jgi:hypothetical protein